MRCKIPNGKSSSIIPPKFGSTVQGRSWTDAAIVTNLLDRVGGRCDGRQHRLVFPVDVGLDAPVETEDRHQDDHNDPEDPSEPGLVGEEDVD